MNSRVRFFPSITIIILAATAGVSTSSAQCADPNLDLGKEIVGAWRGSSGEGNPILLSANSDGITHSSVVSEVSLRLKPNVLTPGQGVWRHVGGRTFELTVFGLFYSISTGKYQGYLKAKVRLTVSADCSAMTGTDKVFIHGPNDELILAAPEGSTSYVRTQPEPYE